MSNKIGSFTDRGRGENYRAGARGADVPVLILSLPCYVGRAGYVGARQDYFALPNIESYPSYYAQ